MLRCTIEMVPGGNEAARYPIGVIEIANVSNLRDNSNYIAVLKKCPPFKGALTAAWRKGAVSGRWPEYDCNPMEDDELTVRTVRDFNRVKLGCYDLLFRAMRACGLEARNP